MYTHDTDHSLAGSETQMCTCIAGQLLLWQICARCPDPGPGWGFLRAYCQRKFAPEFTCTSTTPHACIQKRKVTVYYVLRWYSECIHVWPLFCTWCCMSSFYVQVINITVSTCLGLDLQMEHQCNLGRHCNPPYVSNNDTVHLANKPEIWSNDAKCFSVPRTNLCCPLPPEACVLEACLYLVWRTLATV